MARLMSFVSLTALVALPGCAPATNPGAGASPVPWTPQAVSTENYESSPTFTPDGREMYYVAADRNFRNYRILRSTCQAGDWSSPQPAPFGLPLPVIEADPFVTHDGRRLYFISSRQAPDREDFDIWHVERGADGAWGPAVRLPEPVNSEHAELLPRVTADGTLYFGSDRPGGYGQSDIYAATEDRPGQWTVRNVGPPVSTVANDYEADVTGDGSSMVLVSDRGARSHLYRFVKRNGAWVEVGRGPGRDDVFQVGPLQSPGGDRLLFAQADPSRSGELHLFDLRSDPDLAWPPCTASAGD
jgi:Tol biopolymer transport system component